ncbi:DUF4012 domain-containing protein [Myceligenerans crystallogenes]|uniref:DUF4012 domain-containing protein n=1 Tax=Myceligenerans crystallogenes TaxID=316335 RepID=A0ABP4ZN80_9MICO
MTHPGWGEKWAETPALTVEEPEPGETAGPEPLDPGPDGYRRPPSDRNWVRPPRERVPFWTQRRRTALRAALWAIAALALLLGLVVAWVVYDAVRARAALADAARGVAALQADALEGRVANLDERVARLREDARAAHDATHGPHWSLARELPVAGPSVVAISTLTEVVDELARGPLPELARSVELTDPAAFAPVDGRVDLAPLEKVAPDVVRADESVGLAAQRVARLDGQMLPQVRDAVGRLGAQLQSLRATTATAARAADVLPVMLGSEGPRDYLVLVQNPAEPRALGGIPGTVLQLRADEGKVTLTGQMSGGMMGNYKEPVLPLTQDERVMFGRQDELARWMQNVTLTPDFPRAAELAREMWRLETGKEVDGVLTADPVTLEALLRGGGPVYVDEGRVEPGDLSEYLLNGVYLEHEDPATQDAIFAGVAEQAFARLSAGRGGERNMIEALVVAARQGRLLVWSGDEAVNRRLEGTALDGSLSGVRGDSPVVGVFTQGINMAKIAYYLDTAVDVRVIGERPDGSRELAVTVGYTSKVPEDQVATMPERLLGYGEENPGQIRLRSLVYAPAGGWITGAEMDGKETGLTPKKQGELSVASRDIKLSPGATASVTYVMITGKHQSGDVILRVTPGPRPADITISDADPANAE